MSLRTWVKHALPYEVTCAIARWINRPLLSDIHRSERIVEYAWILNHLRPGAILDYGYAGTYLTEQLCLFGNVTGSDPRYFPITHKRFRYEWPLVSSGYDTITCISTLEHHLPIDTIVPDLYSRLAPGGQLLLTFPSGPCQSFRGYRTIAWQHVSRWPGRQEIQLFHRLPWGWHEHVDLSLDLPTSTEHQVNALACVRITKQPGPSTLTWRAADFSNTVGTATTSFTASSVAPAPPVLTG